MFKKTLLATTAALFATSTFAADVDNTNLDIAFQGAHFQGAGNQITMLRVPVTNKETGETQFFDMSAEFAADKSGNLIFKNISSVQSVAFASANQLVAGHYLDGDGCSWFVEGPSVGANGRLFWSFDKPGNNIGCSNTKDYSGQVASGPVKGNELIVHTDSYAKFVKASNQNLNYGLYNSDYVVSAAQTGQSISFVAYRYQAERKFDWTIRQAKYPGKKED
jgi:hypothetical protein